MGDVLPPKRDSVDRLKRRVELYRTHHNGCLPRYEQGASNIREAERQDTLLLRQRFLESKAKKAKTKSDHHRTYKESVSDNSKVHMTKPVKRTADESVNSSQLPSSSIDDCEKAQKVARTDSLPDKKPDINLSHQSCLGATIKNQQSSQQTATLPTFSVQIVQNFTNQQSAINSTVQTIQTSVTVQNLPNSPLSQSAKPSNKTETCAQEENSTRNQTLSTTVECKQEKDIDKSDLCQFKTVQTPNSGNSCDPLSDTFPGICVNDDSAEDMLPPEILNDLIKDMTDNPDYPDLMTDFFEDSVGSLKEQENVSKDIVDIIKDTPASFQSDSASLVTTQNNEQQLNGLFKNFVESNETQLSTISTIPSSSIATSSIYTKPTQRLPPSYLNANMECLRFDYKMAEPTGSLAARTLKQLAEQHQNLQQQQVFNAPLSSRASFNQDNHYQQPNPLHSPSFLNGSNPTVQNSEKTSTSHAYTLDRLSEEFFGNLPSNCDPISPNTNFDVSKQRISESSNQQLDLQKPPPYNMTRPLNATRPLTHFSANPAGRPLNPMSSQHVPLSPVGNRQVQSNSELRFQFSQSQQVHMGMNPQQNISEALKHQQFNPMHSNVFSCYAQQQSESSAPFQVSMTQSLSVSPSNMTFSSQCSPTLSKPPPEYKSHHHNLQAGNATRIDQPNVLSQPSYSFPNKSPKLTKFQRPPNVTITPDGSALPTTHNWRPNTSNLQPPQSQQNQFRGSLPNFNNYNTGMQTVSAPLPPMFNQYRVQGAQMSVPGSTMQVLGNRMPRQNPIQRNQLPITSNQMNNSRLVTPVSNNALIMQQHQRMNVTQCQQSPAVNCLEQHSSMIMNNNSMSPSRSPMSPMGSFIGQKDIMKNDDSMPPLIPIIRPYSGPKNMMGNEGNSQMGSYNGPKDVINRNAGSHINLDIFDNVPDLFDLSDIV